MSYIKAIDDFRQARRRAAMERIMARLTGRSADLLSYEEVRQKLKAWASKGVSLREIPLDAIVGSVGRYADFTRSFLPTKDSDEYRWARVQLAVTGLKGVPPIDVYQIGEAYFVLDGNHRTSVARQLGATHIQANVTEIHTRVPLTPDAQPDDLILKAEQADFLEHTNLDRLRPGVDLSVTAPGRYRLLEEHIRVHRHYMGIERQQEIPFEEAAVHWLDHVYLPTVQVVRQRGILRDFPRRTETDLYLWISEHRVALEEALEWEIEPGAAATDLAARFGSRSRRPAARIGSRILEVVTPDELEDGPPPGQWRAERLVSRQGDCLFADVLVPISGEGAAWYALEQALEVARREGGRLRGLHIVQEEAQRESDRVLAIQSEFELRCSAAEIAGNLVVEVGKVAHSIAERARWIDLVVISMSHPPGPQPADRLSSGLRTLIRRSPRPVLTVPDTPSPLSRALLAYDGSPKADEALFTATYLGGCWQVPLVVLTVQEGNVIPSAALQAAEGYLESSDVAATFIEGRGPVADAVLQTAREQRCDLILMGGYGHGPVVEVVLGSAVDQVLRESQWPVLICR
jgi:nucleotide-binding universal stress UspA family protein